MEVPNLGTSAHGGLKMRMGQVIKVRMKIPNLPPTAFIKNEVNFNRLFNLPTINEPIEKQAMK